MRTVIVYKVCWHRGFVHVIADSVTEAERIAARWYSEQMRGNKWDSAEVIAVERLLDTVVMEDE